MIEKDYRKVDKEEIKKINETAQDWTAVCPVCHVTLTGTMGDLRKHKHGE